MPKIELDKYYTPIDIAKQLIDKTYDVIGASNITEVVEPSAGNGSFSSQIKGCIAYDIEPENYSIIRQDYLALGIPYKEGRLIIGNPPFGRCLSTAQKFFKKSVEIGDYIAFILPISQLNNRSSLYEFDLIFSKDLGEIRYSDRLLRCCFNIYKRPANGLNERPSRKLKAVTIIRQDSAKFKDADFDLRMCYWGNGSAGKILKEYENYSAEYKIKINDIALTQRVIDVLSTVDWREELNCIAMLKIQQFHIIELLRREIPEIY